MDHVTFPQTRATAIALLRSDEADARSRGIRIVAEVYWPSVYKHLRWRFRMTPEQAEDIVQAFFLDLVETERLASYDPARARFRTYLRQCLDNFAVDAHRRASAKRRKAPELELDFASLEATLGAPPADPAALDREWVRRIAEVAVERLLASLEKRGKRTHAALFRRFHLHDDEPSYQVVADELGITVTDVTNWLHVARREFRHVALALLREITASEEEFVEEAREVFGIDVARSGR
jgi:RNA polymerase sigma factor (sigma-70 family)